jgi:hypothetical protein
MEFAPRTKEVILEETHQSELEGVFDPKNRHGVKSHLFFGHGPTNESFEKRDLCTTNSLVYEQRQKVDTIIDPHIHEVDSTTKHLYQVNARADDLAPMFGSTQTRKPRAYGEYTKSCQSTHIKTGLRQ